MPPSTAPPTWRLLELLTSSGLPCAACGQVHRAQLAGPAERSSDPDVRSRYQQLAERVRRTSIRCEGCGARFEDLEAYRVHPCEVRYR